MNCPSCNQPLPDGASTCPACQAPAGAVCSRCGRSSPTGFAFCGFCGAPLSSAAPTATPTAPAESARAEPILPEPALAAPAPAAPAPAPADDLPASLRAKLREARATVQGERREVTVLFADLSGFTAMSETRDPEEIASFMNTLYRELAQIVDRYGGHVDKFIGDAVMALFGAPIAHEDDPERAVRAALDMLEHIAAKAADGEPGLAMRIGLNLGSVVAGNVGPDQRMAYTVLGDTVNTAARLEKLAPLNSLLVAESVFSRVRTQVEAVENPPLKIRGREAPVRTYCILSCAPGDGRRRLTGGYFGRAREIEIGRRFLELVPKGKARALFVTAEAGSGKSRYVSELRKATADAFQWFEGRSAPLKVEGTSGALKGLTFSLLGMSGHLVRPDPAEFRGRAEKLLGPRRDEAVYLLDLARLPLPQEERAALAAMDPQTRRDNTWLGLWSLVEVRLRSGPVVIFVDDVHWLSESGGAGVHFLIGKSAPFPVAFVFTGRPEATAVRLAGHARVMLPAMATEAEAEAGGSAASEEFEPAAGPEGAPLAIGKIQEIPVQTLPLEPLTVEAQSALLDDLLQELGLRESVRKRILERSGGNPLFLEELVRSLRESGIPEDPNAIHVPSTLQGLLLSRIDRLPGLSRLLLQMAAVLGVDFPTSLLERMFAVEHPDAPASLHLQPLFRGEFLVEAPNGGRGYLLFRHALIQEVAYSTLLKRIQRVYHEWAGTFAEELFADTLEAHAPLISHHFWEAENWPKALVHLWMAGRRASARYALPEADGFFSRAAQLLDSERASLPEEEVLAFWEQGGLTKLNLGDLQSAKAMAEKLAQESRSRGDRTGEARSFDLAGKIAFYHGSHREALQNGTRALEVLPDRESKTAADILNTVGISSFMLGEPEEALRAHEEALRLRLRFEDRLGTAKSYLNIGILHAAYFDDLRQARSYFEKALEIGRELNDRMVITNNLHNLGWVGLELGDYGTARTCFSQALEIRQAINWTFGIAGTLMNLGECDVHTGQLKTAVERLEETLLLWERVDNPGGRFLSLHLLGMAYMKLFSDDKAQSLLEEAVRLAEELGAESELDDLLFTLGRLVLARGDAGRAVELFDRTRRLAERYRHPGRSLLAQAFHLRAERESGGGRTAPSVSAPSLEQVGQRKPVAAVLAYLAAREARADRDLERAWALSRQAAQWSREVGDPSLLRHTALEAVRAAGGAATSETEVAAFRRSAAESTLALADARPGDVTKESFLEHPHTREILELDVLPD